MASDLFDDPNIQAYLAHAQREMLTMMEESALVISVVTQKIDAKMCLEIGAAVLLDKPIIAVICEGATVPANLKRVASVIIEGDMKNEATLAKLKQAMSNVIAHDRRLQ